MGHKRKTCKSVEFIEDTDNGSSVLDITPSDSDVSSSSGSSMVLASVTVSASILDTRDSVDHELDAMGPIPTPPPVTAELPLLVPPRAPLKTKRCRDSRIYFIIVPIQNHSRLIMQLLDPIECHPGNFRVGGCLAHVGG
jgi:hypothetical protein